jgi:site-specific DNA-methyltransferase (adenine-specific)
MERVFSTELGELWQADCLEWLPTVPTGSVDLVFADPPFNLGKDYGEGIDDERPDQTYLRWCRRWCDELVRVLAPGGSLFLYNLPRWNVHLAAHLDGPLTFRHWIAIDIKFSLPIRGRLYPSHYALLYYCKGDRPKTFAGPRQPIETCRHCGGELKDYGGYKNRMNPAGVNLTDVWRDIPPVRHRRHKHRGANELSLKLLDRVLDIGSEPGDLILDPFGGAGTTFVAAELRGRRWMGCELGNTAAIVRRMDDLGDERAQLEKWRGDLGGLFTSRAEVLRERHGHDSSKYRKPE